MIKAIDFFCGAGGLTRGLLDAGIEVLAGVDIDPRLRKTYEDNNTPSRFVCMDIHEISIAELRDELAIGKDDTVLYAACTPCQPFSTLNRCKGRDDRKELLLCFGDVVRESPPDYVIVENVPGLNTAYGRDIYEKFVLTLDACGLVHRAAGCLDAADYGVPQVRKRFIMLAARRSSIALPTMQATRPTVRDAIGEYPLIGDGESCPEVPNHEARLLMSHHRAIVRAVPKDGGSRRDIKDLSVLLPCHRARPDAHKDVFGRMAWDLPAPTLTGRCTDVYCGRFTHPAQDRGISLREAASLQTFGDDYRFHGTFFHIAGQIGNAVPVELAKHLGRAVTSAARGGEP